MTARESLARLHRVMAILHGHPDGLPLDVVAAELSVPPAQLRGEILEFYGADVPPHLLAGLTRDTAVEFLAADGAEADPTLAPVIRAVTASPEAELGVSYLRAEDLVALVQAATALAELEPDNQDLAAALSALARTLVPQATPQPVTDSGTAAILRRAVAERRVVRIDYSRAWRPGVLTREIFPLRLHHTRRGWEVDAGPVVDGSLRTYLVDRIRGVALTGASFAEPAGLADLLVQQRAPEVVQLCVPQGARWVVDRFAESVEVVTADRDDVTVNAAVLPPVAERIGTILTIAGPEAFVVEPLAHADAGRTLARRLLAHHDLSEVAAD